MGILRRSGLGVWGGIRIRIWIRKRVGIRCGQEEFVELGEGEEAAGGAVGGGDVGVGDLFLEGVEGGGEERAEAVGGLLGESGAAVAQDGGEFGECDPAVEGAAMDCEGLSDCGDGCAGDEEFDSGALAVGEEGVVGGVARERVAGSVAKRCIVSRGRWS